MNRNFQDLNIVDKHFRNDVLVIPRGSSIRALLFGPEYILLEYIDSSDDKLYRIRLNYELFENGKKLVID